MLVGRSCNPATQATVNVVSFCIFELLPLKLDTATKLAFLDFLVSKSLLNWTSF